MPYSLKKVSGGYIVEGPNGPKSKKPLSHATALAQMRALYANEPAASKGATSDPDAPSMKGGGKAKLAPRKKKAAPIPPPDPLAVNTALAGAPITAQPDVIPPQIPPQLPPPGSVPGAQNGGKFIQDMHMHKGGLHESLGIPEGQTIPKSKIESAAKKKGKVGAQARLAETLEGLHHGHAAHLGKKLLS